jgi:hypothetical protein
MCSWRAYWSSIQIDGMLACQPPPFPSLVGLLTVKIPDYLLLIKISVPFLLCSLMMF